VLATEHLLHLGAFDLRVERIERALQLGDNVLARFRPLEEDTEILDLARQRVTQLEVVGQAASPLQRLLSVRLILPEIGCSNAGFELGQFVGGMCSVKDSSADRWPA
jgi:hypothetical protein